MSLNPGYHEQQRLAAARARRTARFSAREWLIEALIGGAYVLVAAALFVASAPVPGSFTPVAAACCVVAFMLASVTEFDTDNGVFVPTQLTFVPLLFALPPGLVPIVMPAVWALAKLPEVVRGELNAIRLWAAIRNSWFALGPVAVLVLAGVHSFHDATAPILLAALCAQFACDFAASALRESMIRGATLREQAREVWIYGVDAALAPVGLLVAATTDESRLAAAALLPLIGVLMVFARERRRRVESLVELNNAYQGMALVLGDVVEHDDGYTGEHCRDVVELALAVGRELDLEPAALRNLEFAALLHDVGKVAIPKSIINKPGRLDPAEFELIKTHTIEGQRMLDRVGGFMSDVGLIVRSHHERWDGRGYPDGLAGEEISLEARIIACCDSYNAMTTDRSYRAALPPEVAAQEVRDCSGTQFDPRVAMAALATIAGEAGDPAPPEGVLVSA